jgi:ribokinase
MPCGQGKVLPYEMLQIAEGMASSAAFAVARLGGKASLWGAVGDDDTGTRITTDLADDGVDTSGMRRVKGARSAVSTILIDDNGERLIVPFYDRNLHENPQPITDEKIGPFDAVLVDVRWPELAREVLLAARRAGKPAILDGDVAADGVIERLAPAASHIVFSQPAAERLARTKDVAAAARALKQRFPHAFISITAGENGCYWFDDGDRVIKHLPALHVTAIDTLAAGDIFHGAFALMIAEGRSIEDAMRVSAVAAAIKCTVFGGRKGAPTRADVSSRLANWQPALATVEHADRSRNEPG